MAPPFISSDPHAWLRPYYVALVTSGPFGNLAPALQFEQLLAAAGRDHPTKIRELLVWNDQAQRGLLSWLADVVAQRPPTPETELWRVRKEPREVRAVAVYLPIGVDLRLMEGADFLRTELLRDAPAVNAKAAEWRRLLESRGWR